MFKLLLDHIFRNAGREITLTFGGLSGNPDGVTLGIRTAPFKVSARKNFEITVSGHLPVLPDLRNRGLEQSPVR
ncbi:MAG TPA: hypothetical protein VMT53_00855 [Terriglobales bacterium]|nr:hypothetical protein [Terriglobales bacterium]